MTSYKFFLHLMRLEVVWIEFDHENPRQYVENHVAHHSGHSAEFATVKKNRSIFFSLLEIHVLNIQDVKG